MAVPLNDDTNAQAAEEATKPVVPVWLSEAAEAEAAEEAKRKNRNFAIVIGVALVALVISYALGVHHYTTHFVPGTTVGNIDASDLSIEELATAIDDEIGTFSTRVSGDGLDFAVTASDVSLSVDGKTLAADAHGETNPYAWPMGFWSHQVIEPEVGVTFNEDQLKERVASVVETFNESAEAPTDATPVYDAEQELYVMQPSALGTQVDADAVSAEVIKSVSALKPKTTIGEAQLARADILDDNESLAAVIEEANKIVSLHVPLQLDGTTLITVGPELISQWMSFYQDDSGMHVYIDQNAIHQWSYDNLNSIVNGENETRTWEVNSWDVATELQPRLASADGSAMEIPTITISTRPDESEGHETRGRHIDVNLSTQYARLYDTDGKTVLWRSYFVSGNEAMGHSTPTGEFEINNMEQGVVLTGLNDGVVLEEGQEPGPEDYYNSYVDYWMCFLGTEYGLHDATWRYDEEFGGDTYLWNGSHGCINLPHDAAGELYSLIHVGEKVYIHY